MHPNYLLHHIILRKMGRQFFRLFILFYADMLDTQQLL